MENLNANNLFRVPGMVAVITGGATGIGLMMTKALVANGAAKVYVVGRRKEKLEEAAANAPEVIIPLVGDVTSQSDLQSIASSIASKSGYINLLVCNSGMLGPNVPILPGSVPVAEYAKKAMESVTMEEYTETLNVNVSSVTWTAYAFLELLSKGNESGVLPGVKSQILVTSSIAALNKAPASGFAYKTSKAAVSHLAKNMSSTFAAYDIRCNAIAPGLFPSELASSMLTKATKHPSEEGSFEKSFIPAGRAGTEEDMGGTILYMVSRAGAYLNGTILVIDGGRLNMLPGY